MNVLNQNVLNDFISYLKTVRYKNLIQDLRLEYCTDADGDYIYLVCIKIKKSVQQNGYGSTIMDDIVQLADKYNVRVRLYATDIYGTPLKVLYGFYKKHGFVLIKNDNDGQMIYYPQKIRKN
jgi:GNAT superfamily N-acetyltransferase